MGIYRPNPSPFSIRALLIPSEPFFKREFGEDFSARIWRGFSAKIWRDLARIFGEDLGDSLFEYVIKNIHGVIKINTPLSPLSPLSPRFQRSVSIF